MRDTENMEGEMEYDDGEEPSFSDPEDFVDDISDQGKRGLRYLARLLTAYESHT